eukprot:TRINITY_DN23617_c0_g1_i1.p1 TRINITY_DN23617_c0_g1~~TRINITY_DN23617_c0_g1_i1.p1  ORF type:complete len:740 (+),score=111.49 TRINITY_DN23617_c0_g1_i1:25-2244(+)
MVQTMKTNVVAHHIPAGQRLDTFHVRKRTAQRSPAHSKDAPSTRKPPSTAPASARSSPSPSKNAPLPSKGKPGEAWGIEEIDEQYAEEQVERYQRDAVEAILSRQQRDMHIMIAAHHDQALALLMKSDEAATVAWSENARLQAKIAEMTKKSSELHVRLAANQPLQTCSSCSTRELVEKELMQTKKVLLKRDEQARAMEAESRELRDQLQQLTARQRPGIHAQMALQDGVEELTVQDSQDEMFRTTSSFWRGSKPPATAFSAATADSVVSKTRSRASGFDLLGELKLPGQQYEDREGNFFQDPEDVESDDGDQIPSGGFQGRKLRRGKTGSMLDVKARMQQLFADKDTGLNLLKTSGCAQRIVKSTLFENLTMVIIIMNVVWIGVDSLVNDADILLDADPPVIMLENAFCIFFTFELGVRFSAFASKFSALKDSWFIFDSLLVSMMILETWVFTLTALATNSAGVDLREGSVLRVLRLVRIFRVTRIIRLLHAMPEVMILVKALFVASRTVFYSLFLLGVVIYIFGIAFTHMSKGFSSHGIYFSDLWASMFTLTFQGCLGDGLTSMARACFSDSVFLALLLCAYILFAPLTVLNMIVAVMVEVVSQVGLAERESMMMAYVEDSIGEVLRNLDRDHNQLITLEEFTRLVDDKEAMSSLHEIGLDVLQLVENPDMIFGPNDTELSFKEFVDEILLLRVNNTATLKDLVHMRKTLLQEVTKLITKQTSDLKKRNGSNFMRGF